MSAPFVGLQFLRHYAGVSQARMADLMGMPLRTYEDIEAGRSKYRPVHLAAGKWALLQIAAEKRDLSILPLEMQAFCRSLAALESKPGHAD